jgi:type I restriction-modification system DNA methylase subunit
MAILCDPIPHWRPNQYLENTLGCQISFTFLTTKLLDYQHQWITLEQNLNPFATVVMAHLKTQATRHDQQERKTWKLYLIRRLYEQGYQREQIINLFTFIDWLMVLPEELEQEVWQTLQDYEQEKRMPYVTSVERIGIEKGRQEGIQEGRQEGIQEGRQEGIQEGAHQQALKSLLRILQRRFENISIPLQRRLQKLTTEQLEGLIDSALTSASLREFTANVPKVNRTSHKTGQKPKAVTTVSEKRIPPRSQ